MNKQCKPSEGPWKITHSGPNGLGSHKHQIGTDHKTVGYAWLPLDAEGKPLADVNEHFANALLFAEAGTVYHETKLTPRQLLAQRDELLAALKYLLEEVCKKNGDPFDGATDTASCAIANAEKGE